MQSDNPCQGWRTVTCEEILELNAKPDAIESLRKWLEEILPDTRGYDGCVSVEIVQDQAD